MYPDNLVTIAVVGTTHGYNGMLKAQISSSHPERFQQLKSVMVDDASSIREFHIEKCTLHHFGILIKLAGIDSKEEAEKLRHARLCVHESDVFPLPADEFYYFQLIGLEVYDEGLGYLGKLTDIIETGANDVYAVQSERYGEILLPAIEQVVLKIDLAKQRMDVRLLEGLIDDK